jgi:hypothetical protein
MSPFVIAAFTCWVCVLIARPRKPVLGNEVEEFVYARLLGRHHLLVGFAAAVTVASGLLFALALPRQVEQHPTGTPDIAPAPAAIIPANADLERLRGDHCVHPPSRPFTCYELQAGGMWMKKELRDGQWVAIGTVVAPPTGRDP